MLKGFSALALAVAIGAGAASAACPKVTSGATFTAEELLESAGGIYLVQVAEMTPGAEGQQATGKFKIVETLRGAPSAELTFSQAAADEHGESDFEGHASNTFWTELRGGGGRSKFAFGACQPAHAFKQGETYLLFPDMLGAMKSAEIIRKSDDEWLKFVRSRAGGGDG